MAILLDEKTTVLVQGITGREGSARARFMLDYGTKVMAGVTPGRGGTDVYGIPVYNTIQEAQREHGPIDASVVFVPGLQVKSAVLEAISAGVKLIVMPVERVPLHDTLEMLAHARRKSVQVIGPGSLGVVSPEKAIAGWIGGTEEMTREIFMSGPVGVISRSGGQTTTLCWSLKQSKLGVSTAIHVGAEPIVGTAPAEVLPLFEKDEQTKAVVMFGEIGTVAEEEAAEVIKEGRYTKPLVIYIAGATAREGMRFSHASAIIERGRGSAQSKITALESVGATVVGKPQELATEAARILEVN